MKKAIHPEYYKEAKVSCVCGNTFTVGSTRPEINVEICAACHPFYTGKQKLVDAARRVDKFNKRTEAKTVTVKKTVKKEKQKALKASKKAEQEGVKIIRK